jgi:hypothetical protein
VTDNKQQPLLLIQSIDGAITETRLEGVPTSESYGVSWSPDEAKLLIRLENNSSYIVNTEDYSVVQVMQSLELDDLRLSLNWYGEDHLLLAELTRARTPITLGRWLINPSAED